MKQKIKILILAFLLFFPSILRTTEGQMLSDTASVNQIKKCIGYIYNFQFDKARVVYQTINHSYPDHPAMLVLKGLITYWENYPLTPTSPACSSFEKDLLDCIQLCEKKHNPGTDAEYLLTSLCARGFLLLYYSDNDLSVEVFPLATSSYQYIRRSYNFTSYFPDFYFFTGMYDYYREAYPEAYPIYETLAILFPKGNKAVGLRNIVTASAHSIFLKAESLIFLSTIYLCFENNYLQAYFYSKSLYELYPENLEYRSEYIKNLLLIKKYDEAEKLITTSGSSVTNPYHRTQLLIFNGILQEKKYRNFEKAKQLYEKGIRDIAAFDHFGNNSESLCYFGLSRISGIKGNKQFEKLYRKQAQKLADFKKINFDE
jgi:hypothetical protein